MKKSKKLINSSRRNFLAGSATMAGLAAVATTIPTISIVEAADAKKPDAPKSLPDFVKWKKGSTLIVHSDKGIETKRGDIGAGIVTPLRSVYIRNNLTTLTDKQIGKRSNWKISIEGVKKPTSFTLAQLQSMGQTTVATVLQCSGNGRKFFPHKPSGSKWETGAAACLIWTGVPVSTVAKACGGIVDNAKFMTGTGADLPADNKDPKANLVERSVPRDKYEDSILAWEVNGVDIPNAHGGPLRLVVPGYFGINNIKHIGKLAFTAKESEVKNMASSYRVYPVGQKGSPKFPTCWEMNVKSWITSPMKKAKSGSVVISGVAFGGTSSVSGVEVSVDGGKNWNSAKFVGPDLGKYAWRQFVYETKLKPGKYNIASKASAWSGTQPEKRMENNRGYLNNSWKDHSLDITVS